VFKNQIIIIDDFYDEPDRIRQMALAMNKTSASGNYAGSMTDQPFFTEDHARVFQLLTGETVVAGTKFCGRFRFTHDKDRASQHIHFDPAPGQIWAGVLYLSLPEHYQHQSKDNNFGTEFWQHRQTGLSSIPLLQPELDRYGWYGVPELRHFLETDGMDESLWTQTLQVPMCYNRLVLFRPWLFHSPGRWFGNTDENCRLIQTFFLATPEYGGIV
jgi:hypothetical protein